MASVEISVLVPIFNEERHVRIAVESMQAQRVAGACEFLLLDGGSTDSTLAELAPLLEGDPRLRLLRRPGATRGELLNLGLRSAHGDLIARMDAHTVFPPSYLADGTCRLALGDVASVSGPAIAVGSGTWSRRIALALRSRIGRGGARFRHLSEDEIEVDSGYCGLWQGEVLRASGGWNESAHAAEDVELAARIRQSGGRIVCVPSMAGRYLPRDTLRGLAAQYWRYAHYRVWSAGRHPEMFRRSHVVPPLLVTAAVAAVGAPRPAARLGRRLLKLYAAVVCAESARLGRGEPPRDALGVAVVFVTMHFAWGTGFLVSCVRHGPPWAALGLQLRRASKIWSRQG
ncbi:MAG: glycosyltransferase [Solirubrobacteraceae bacterium]